VRSLQTHNTLLLGSNGDYGGMLQLGVCSIPKSPLANHWLKFGKGSAIEIQLLGPYLLYTKHYATNAGLVLLAGNVAHLFQTDNEGMLETV